MLIFDQIRETQPQPCLKNPGLPSPPWFPLWLGQICILSCQACFKRLSPGHSFPHFSLSILFSTLPNVIMSFPSFISPSASNCPQAESCLPQSDYSYPTNLSSTCLSYFFATESICPWVHGLRQGFLAFMSPAWKTSFSLPEIANHFSEKIGIVTSFWRITSQPTGRAIDSILCAMTTFF